jgi:hypothetical protein
VYDTTVRIIERPPGKEYTPITFREGDRHVQPGERPLNENNDREWAEGRGNPSCLGWHTTSRPLGGVLKK